jgi:hypothetical protein
MKKIKLDIRLKEKPGKIQKYALVDDEDFERISQYNWTSKIQKKKFVSDTCYAYRYGKDINNKKIFIFMHREILGLTKKDSNKIVDHIDHNGLNNSKTNLRICSQRQNVHNMRPHRIGKTSDYKGVSWNKKTKKWRVKIQYNREKSIWLGQNFISEIEAAKIYDAAAVIIYKEFAFLNLGKPTQKYLKEVKKLINNIVNRKFSSKYRGVTLEENRWRATILHKGKKYSLGKYGEEKEAALAYNKKAKELLGDEAKLNKL